MTNREKVSVYLVSLNGYWEARNGMDKLIDALEEIRVLRGLSYVNGPLRKMYKIKSILIEVEHAVMYERN